MPITPNLIRALSSGFEPYFEVAHLVPFRGGRDGLRCQRASACVSSPARPLGSGPAQPSTTSKVLELGETNERRGRYPPDNREILPAV
jgi:hypothetical protein